MYQGGYWLGELKRVSGLTHDDFGTLLVQGLATRHIYGWGEPDPDSSWGVEITPRGEALIDVGHMHTFLSSIATADPQTEQAEWMVRTAREGLRLDVI